MTSLVPNRFLFRFEFPLRYRKSPVIDGDLRDWSDEFLVPDFGQLDAEPGFAKIYLAWNESGLFIAAGVRGRRGPFQCNPKQFWKGDNLRLMTDMRDTRDLKRGSRYCQQFYFLPSGGGPDGRSPTAAGVKVHRATENAPPVAPGLVQVAGQRDANEYTLEGFVPAEALNGFDPAEHPRIGLYTILEDTELGQHYLTVGDDLSWWVDPSTWATAVLTR
jgi:hypothetical protein